jgi:DNA-binding transcriptional regulator YdaS (Cro superfamily)
MRIYNARMTKNQKALAALIRAAGSQKRLADILDTSEERVSRWVNGKHAAPTFLPVLAEFIESTPQKDWPERWKR